jgi:Beta propeller domain
VGKRTALVAVLAVLSGTAAVEALDGSAAPAARAEGARLLRFGSCADLLDYMKQNAQPHVSAWGFLGRQGVQEVGPVPQLPALPVGIPAPSPPVATTVITSTAGRTSAPAEDEYSTTNVQEPGVDEPDLAKSNGSTLFAVAGAKLHAVDIRGERPRRVDSLVLRDGSSHQLLLSKDTLLVLSYDEDHARGEPGLLRTPHSTVVPPHEPPPPPRTTLTQVDVSSPGWMKVVRRLTFDGRYLSARLAGGSVRVVFTTSVPEDLDFFRPRSFHLPAEALERNRSVIADSKAANWLPSYEIRNVRTKRRSARSVQCRHVSRPPRFSGFGMLTVLTIDVDRGLAPVESDAILGDGDIVYASDSSLYAATQRWTAGERVTLSAPPKQSTLLHKFDISHPERTAYRASGTVPGYLLNQWALSEHRGVLRAATTEFPTWWTAPASESAVTTLREEAGRLVQIGRVGGLGRGERIFGVRFIGDVGYVVTFRQTDPLYTIDLSRPAAPKLLGELKIPGYSAYLHPAGEDLLLGLGQDATEDGAVTGTQLSVFDVSDLHKPVRLHRRTIEDANSEAESDHHAFLYWKRTRLVVVPIETLSPLFQGVVGFRIGREGLAEVGRITHARGKLSSSRSWSSAQPIQRTFVVRDALLTVSAAGVRASDLQTFADRGWAGFDG